MKKVLVIAGLTASGKTSLSIEWAQLLNGQIINADSQQVYRGLDIGTAKISEQEKMGVKHHLIDCVDYASSFNVKTFQGLCRQAIDVINAQEQLPILVGGTGLYLKAALYDYEFKDENEEINLFESIPTSDLYQKLIKLDPRSCDSIHENNRKRIVRALNMAENGSTRTQRIQSQNQEALYDVYWLVLTPAKPIIDTRIEERVNHMFELGLQDEVMQYFSLKETRAYQSFQAIGYKEWADYFEKNEEIDKIKEKIIIHTRQFAKRQMTWFRHQIPARFVDSMNRDEVDEALKEIKNWLKEKV